MPSETPPPLPWRFRTRAERSLLLVCAAVAVFGAFWCAVAAVAPGCWTCAWKTGTGFPCAGCGGTRAVLLLLGGRWTDALQMNPGAVAAAVVWAVLTVYAASVLVFRFEPWRPPWTVARAWRWMLAAAVAVNWLYVLASGRV